jgi:hypothetical protein
MHAERPLRTPNEPHYPEPFTEQLSGPVERYEHVNHAIDFEGVREELKERVEAKLEQLLGENYREEYSVFGERELEALYVLEYHQSEAVEHSILTCQLMHNKLKHQRIHELIEQDYVDDEVCERAALLHDIGKISVSPRILNDQTPEPVWHRAYEHWADEVGEAGVAMQRERINDYNRAQYGANYHEHELRDIELVPMVRVLSEEEQQQLERAGIDPHSTLKQLVDHHEGASVQVLEMLGFQKEALLAGQHHHVHQADDDRHAAQLTKIAADVEGLEYDDPHYRAYFQQFSDLLHFTDVTQALGGRRGYQERMRPPEQVATIFIAEAEQGDRAPAMVYTWLKDGVETGELCDNDADPKDCKRIRDFLKEVEFSQGTEPTLAQAA